MPTPTGKPKVGERIRWRVTIFGEHGPWREGVVIRRTDGELWSLKVRLDNGREEWLTTAGWYANRGDLEIIK